MEKRKIIMLTTGGTIACVESENGLTPGMGADRLTQYLHLNPDLVTLHTLEVMAKDSTNLVPMDWIRLAQIVAMAVQKGYEGIVISHGTDTMSYTTAALSYMLENIPVPVIFTGAQLPIDAPDSDAPQNLQDAIEACLVAGPGVYLMFAGTLMDGSSVKKVHTTDKEAFESINCEAVGYMCDSLLELTDFGRKLFAERQCYASTPMEYKPKEYEVNQEVALIKLFPGMNPDIFNYYLQRGVSGVVVEAYGTGGVPSEDTTYMDYFRRFESLGVPVYITTQCLKGGTHMEVYEVNRLAKGAGVIEGGKNTTENLLVKLLLSQKQ